MLKKSPSRKARASRATLWLSLNRGRHDAELVQGPDHVEVGSKFDDQIVFELDELNAVVDDLPVGRGNVARGPLRVPRWVPSKVYS